MRKIIFLLFFILFFLINLTENETLAINEFNDIFIIEQNLLKCDSLGYCQFVENAVKMEYTTENSIEKEKERLIAIFEKNKYVKVSYNENNITAEGQNIKCSTSIYSNDNYTRVEIVIINNVKSTLNNSIKYLNKNLIDDNCIDIRLSYVIKFKINGDNVIDEISKNINNSTIKSIYIDTGKVSKAILNDGNDITFAQVSYGTDSYLIIGTPTIFITY